MLQTALYRIDPLGPRQEMAIDVSLSTLHQRLIPSRTLERDGTDRLLDFIFQDPVTEPKAAEIRGWKIPQPVVK
jgi:hypothetical protein